jgi:hypothetical protein
MSEQAAWLERVADEYMRSGSLPVFSLPEGCRSISANWDPPPAVPPSGARLTKARIRALLAERPERILFRARFGDAVFTTSRPHGG